MKLRRVTILLIWLFIVLSILGFLIYKNSFSPEIPCLEKIAEDYCESEGLYFDEINWGFGWGFWCRENLRRREFKRYNFLEEEIEECKNG